MVTHCTYTGSAWTATLPSDWVEAGERDESAPYFESADHLFGLYIAVWNVGDATRSADDLLGEFCELHCKQLDASGDGTWEHAGHRTGTDGALIDSFNGTQGHRVICRPIEEPARPECCAPVFTTATAMTPRPPSACSSRCLTASSWCLEASAAHRWTCRTRRLICPAPQRPRELSALPRASAHIRKIPSGAGPSAKRSG